MAMAIRSVPVEMLPSLNSMGKCGDLGVYKGSTAQKARVLSSLETNSRFLGNFNGFPPLVRHKRKISKKGGLVIVNELGGQYEEGFEDVHVQLMNVFTYKAVRTVLHQLYEMNPPSYRWLYNFIATNNPKEGKYFLRNLGKEKQDLAERVMITRLHLYGKWIKKCDHAMMYQKISDENLQLMRERLIETVIWPSDDTNSEKVG